VETFLLSCRVLGRGVEHAMLAHIGNLALTQNKRSVTVHFHPSAKNKPAHDFLGSVGAQFKQALNGGFVYVFPAEFAAGIKFSAQNSEASEVIESSNSRTESSPSGGRKVGTGALNQPGSRSRQAAMKSCSRGQSGQSWLGSGEGAAINAAARQ